MRRLLQRVINVSVIAWTGLPGCRSSGYSSKPAPLTEQNRAYVALADAAVEMRLRYYNEHLAELPAVLKSGNRKLSLDEYDRNIRMGCLREYGENGTRPAMLVDYHLAHMVGGFGGVNDWLVQIHMDTNELEITGGL